MPESQDRQVEAPRRDRLPCFVPEPDVGRHAHLLEDLHVALFPAESVLADERHRPPLVSEELDEVIDPS